MVLLIHIRFQEPQVVCYKGNQISYEIAKRIIKLKYISLVNLILDREVVTELIQSEFNKKRVSQELTKILDEHNRSNLFSNYYDLEDRLGGIGASEKTAKIIIEELKK